MVGTIKVGKLQAAAGTSDTISIESGHKISGAAGALSVPGVVIQTVDFTHNTELVVNSTTFTNTGLSGVITPKFSNSKIFVTVFQQIRLSGDHDHGLGFKIQRTIGGTTVDVYDPVTRYEYYLYDGTNNSANDERHDRFPMFVVDTPSSTSACTYSVQFASMRTDNNNNAKAQPNGNISMGHLMEIAQ
tara:strand:+ start:4029 stop:4592 length:564 start_codon:yes stop_codon:yes gene_type:complete